MTVRPVPEGTAAAAGTAAGLVSLADVRAARDRIGDRVHRTPLLSARSIDVGPDVEVFVKAELLQRTGSFKVRGVLNTLLQLPDEALRRGVVSMSAGNHAAALAFGARSVGTSAAIVMPAGAVRAKVDATRAYGGEVVLTDRPLPDVMHELAAERQLTVVHPFDDPRTIAGAGTVGLELAEDRPDVDLVLVPVGGGGLISGVAVAVRALVPTARIVGVEPETADGMSRALRQGGPVPLDHPVSVADGLAAPFAGVHTLRHVERLVDDVVRVPETAFEQAVRVLVQRTKFAVEPSAAAGLAALQTGAVPVSAGTTVALVLSGGNVDPSELARILTG